MAVPSASTDHRSRRWTRRYGLRAVSSLCVLAVAACSSIFGDDELDLSCNLDEDYVASGGPGKDGIPALTDPDLVGAFSGDELAYLRGSDRVIGLVIDDQAYAIPHNILWWHEIVNLNVGSHQVAVTFCPLTGSSMAFDRSAVGGQEFGVSGLLFQSNLMMYNRGSDESYWPQMLAGARCGPRKGEALPMYPVLEATWDGWRALHPETLVIDGHTGHDRDYTEYPYGNYESLSDNSLAFPIPFTDTRRPVKERVIGLPSEDDSPRAFPFGALEEQPGPWGVVEISDFEGEPAVVLWSDQAKGGMAFRTEVNGSNLAFAATDDGIKDTGGSTWSVEGVAISGPLAGTRLEPIETAYVAFWGAWAVFHTGTELWTGN